MFCCCCCCLLLAYERGGRPWGGREEEAGEGNRYFDEKMKERRTKNGYLVEFCEVFVIIDWINKDCVMVTYPCVYIQFLSFFVRDKRVKLEIKARFTFRWQRWGRRMSGFSGRHIICWSPSLMAGTREGKSKIRNAIKMSDLECVLERKIRCWVSRISVHFLYQNILFGLNFFFFFWTSSSSSSSEEEIWMSKSISMAPNDEWC